MFEAPCPPYDPTDPYTTVVHRWPVIITGVIGRMHRLSHEYEIEKESLKLRIDEAKSIIEKISRLKDEMGRNYIMQPISSDGEPAGIYNSELQRLAEASKNTWFTTPWLFAEYRLLRSFFVQTTQWSSFDPFSSQKAETFQQSGKAIYQIATTMYELQEEHVKLKSDADKLGVLFREMIQMCLWGNATDLSLLTHLSSSNIEHLQTVGKDVQAAREEFILWDDQEKVWSHMKSLSNGRVDFLFTDLVFADFLVTYTPHVSTVVFHPKLIPWFVSDVTPGDFAETITSLLNPAFLPPLTGMNYEHLQSMVKRWERYVDEGVFALAVPAGTPLGGGSDGVAELAEFWTSPAPYWDMRLHAPKLWEGLKASNLVIFKVNFAIPLTGDVKWPAWTAFSTALGPLAGSFPLLSLRTNKADVVVGVEREVAERLDSEGPAKWRVDGRYALI
ncbi:hypothetical protein B0H19DRAFT_1171131 [Mycena capillaripes]|nr:hypothetical protein B0H19DRAFT_1171131 [Mycena capillaripes]